jgi:hypothetical protein
LVCQLIIVCNNFGLFEDSSMNLSITVFQNFL